MGPPQPSCNSTLRPPKPKNITHIQFDTMYAHPNPKPRANPNPNPRAIPNPNGRPIPNPDLTRYAASARESEIKFFVVDVPREVYFFKVVVVPLTGDPDIYISFDTRTPTGANYTFMQDLP